MPIQTRTLQKEHLSRREFCAGLLGAAALAGAASSVRAEAWKPNYILASALYGTFPLADILPEIAKTGSACLDVWCLKHGNQREQIEEMGHDAFSELLKKHGAKVGSFTNYPLGPFGLQPEIKILAKFGGSILVTGSGGPKGLSGAAAKAEMAKFLEKMKPHADAAGAAGVKIAIENHSASLLHHPDSLRAFVELNKHSSLGVALAPHHLHTFAEQIPQLIEDLGSHLIFFYAQEHGRGYTEKLPKNEELMQLPGFGGGLDYKPVLRALRKINYPGWIEIFMHPTPRGIPILPRVAEVSAAVNKSRAYLEQCLP
ncbi:MAG TPA: TIM barrel protein [Planctomycetota bacterium]|nr:TIM barrel protein [Planctomycetota bacterium]